MSTITINTFKDTQVIMKGDEWAMKSGFIETYTPSTSGEGEEVDGFALSMVHSYHVSNSVERKSHEESKGKA